MYFRHKTLTGAEYVTIEDDDFYFTQQMKSSKEMLLRGALGAYKENPQLETLRERDCYKAALEKIAVYDLTVYSLDIAKGMRKIAKEALDE